MTPTDAKIASLRASGLTLCETGAIVGYSKSGVEKRGNKPDVRALIEKLSREFAEQNAAKILQAQADAISCNQETWADLKAAGRTPERHKLATEAKDLLEQSDKVVKRASQAMGLTPSAAPSIFLQQVFNGPSQVVLADSLTQLFGSQLPTIEDQDEDIIDL